MTEIIDWIMALMRSNGPLSVFVGVMLEQIIVPIPSPLIVMGAGAILIDPSISWLQAAGKTIFVIVLPGMIASTLGSFIGYGIGYWGGKPLVTKCQKWLDLTWEDIEKMEVKFRQGKNEAWSMILLRAIPVFPLSLVSVFGGLIRMQAVPFGFYTLLGSAIRCFILGLIGWRVGETYYQMAHQLNSFETLVSAGILLVCFGILGYLCLKHRR